VHATTVKVRISEETLADPEFPNRRRNFVEATAKSPGFVSGYWLQPTDGVGTAVVLWESEAAALAASEAMGVKAGAQLGPGAVAESVEHIEVWEHR
jgi:hypothetical protein